MNTTTRSTSKKDMLLNQALTLMSLSEVTSIKESLRRAEKIDLFWFFALNEMLMRHDWNWARRKVKLTNVVKRDDNGLREASCQFEYPNDYVHGIGLSCGGIGECCCKSNHQVNFRRIDSNLEIDFLDCCSCCNDHDYMVYVADSFDPAEWQPLFAQAFVYCLAMKCIEAFRSDLNRKKDLQADYEKYLALAIDADDKESNRVKFPIHGEFQARPFLKSCNYRYIGSKIGFGLC